jgi:hypothetical protein
MAVTVRVNACMLSKNVDQPEGRDDFLVTEPDCPIAQLRGGIG